MENKPILTAKEAVKKVKSGSRIMCGGFGMTGTPVHLLHALAGTNTGELTYIGNNVGEPGLGGDRLIQNGQLKKMIGSFFTSNPNAADFAQSGKVDYELMPQGTLAEAIRAGGCGIGGFYTETAAGTKLATGLDSRTIDGRQHIFIKALKADVAFIRAWKADESGNLIYRLTEQNFNTAMAMAAKMVIVEAEEIVPTGALDPSHIHTQACFVDYLVQGSLTKEHLGSSAETIEVKNDSRRQMIAKRALMELKRGDIVNLGVGIPTLVADLISPEKGIVLHSENGMLGAGPEPTDGEGAMIHPVNAGKKPVTALPGSSYFDSALSFGMIRGGHIDAAVMGALEVDGNGNLANWAVPGKPLLGVGGAMDLAVGAKKLIITMFHTNKDGSPKLVKSCSLPLTGSSVVDMIITDLAVFKKGREQFELIELMPGATVEEIKSKTGFGFIDSR